KLSLPLVAFGALPIDLIRRPPVNENTSNPLIYDQRYFTYASLRILLSDTAAEIMALPTVVQTTQPTPLDGSHLVAQYGAPVTTPNHRSPFATSPGINTLAANSMTVAAAPASPLTTVNLTALPPPRSYF